MRKVITYGTFDLLHHGHIRLLERAKNLGDYLIVGVTAEDFDKKRGKINVQQSLSERIASIQSTNLADQIIIEEYEGQKIDDILKYDVDVFAIGSDWIGKFDYLKEYCEVIYLDRTKGISSTELRSSTRSLKLGIVGDSNALFKIIKESEYVNGLTPTAISTNSEDIEKKCNKIGLKSTTFSDMVDICDAVYIISHPKYHYDQIKYALDKKKHVLCESPIALNELEYDELTKIAENNNLILMDSLKTAYSTAYSRLILLAKSGKIGKVVSIDATCTSLKKIYNYETNSEPWGSIYSWGPTALMPVFQLLGDNYISKQIITTKIGDYDLFTQINFVYPNGTASIKVGKGIKSEGQLIITGTEGYIYVPAPWWKTDYFEIRYENQNDNRKYYYQLEGEGIRYELVEFVKNIQNNHQDYKVTSEISRPIISLLSDYAHAKGSIYTITW